MYSVDWIAKVLSIPTSDLALVSGTRYRLLMSDFLIEVRRLESEFAGGLWAPQMVGHDNTRLDFAGVNYAPFDELINGYTLQITGIATRVDLIGSNNNIVDVLIATGVSVVPSNSAGLQVYFSGSGVTEQDKTDIANSVWSHVEAAFLMDIIKGKKSIEKTGDVWELIILNIAGDAVILRKDLKDKNGDDITDLEAGVLAQELLSSV